MFLMEWKHGEFQLLGRFQLQEQALEVNMYWVVVVLVALVQEVSRSSAVGVEEEVVVVLQLEEVGKSLVVGEGEEGEVVLQLEEVSNSLVVGVGEEEVLVDVEYTLGQPLAVVDTSSLVDG